MTHASERPPITSTWLDQVEQRAREATERASKATAGPWERLGGSGRASALVSTVDEGGPDLAEVFGPHEPPSANADFIAAAREDVPVLAAAVLALVSEVWCLREEATRSAPRSPEEEEAMDIIRRAAESLRAKEPVPDDLTAIETSALASGEPPRAGEEQP
jgi:hypothetical protein